MTLPALKTANTPAARFEVAFAELAASPLVAPGICMNPLCSQHFAPALLAWRAGKYEKENDDLRDLSRVGRNYVSRLSSDWWNDRLRRATERGDDVSY